MTSGEFERQSSKVQKRLDIAAITALVLGGSVAILSIVAMILLSHLVLSISIGLVLPTVIALLLAWHFKNTLYDMLSKRIAELHQEAIDPLIKKSAENRC